MIPELDPAKAIISREKVTGYLLSSSHPIGRYKAAFFASLGYSVAAPEVFERDLALLLKAEISELDVTEYGRKFSSRGLVTGPNGRQASVWRSGLYFRASARPIWSPRTLRTRT